MRLVLKTTNRQGSLQTVIGLTTDGLHLEFTTKYSLEKACLDEAGCRFSQANNTPLLQEPLLHRFGELGTNWPEFKKVLAGKSTQNPNDNIYMTKLMQQLCQPEPLREITPRSLQDYTTGWRRAQETTASSMLGIHFGHYMAGTFNPDIVLFNATMADLPMKTG